MSIQVKQIKIQELPDLLENIHVGNENVSIEVINEDGSVNIGLSMKANNLIVLNMRRDEEMKQIMSDYYQQKMK